MRQRRNKKTSISWTQAEHAMLMNAKKTLNERSLASLIVRLIEDRQIIVVREIQPYDAIYAKAGNLANQIAKGLHYVRNHPDKYQNLIGYLERSDAAVLKVLMEYSERLGEAIEAYHRYDENIEIISQMALLEAKTKKARQI